MHRWVDRLGRSTILAAVLLAACGAVSPSASPSPGASSTAKVPLRTPPTVAPRTVIARDQDNGHAISVRVGDHVYVVLGSTYWSMDGSSNAAVLRPTVAASASPQTGRCVTGAGCGVVTAQFDAVAAGRADVTANRTTCGEALACTGSQGAYRVTVVVAGSG